MSVEQWRHVFYVCKLYKLLEDEQRTGKGEMEGGQVEGEKKEVDGKQGKVEVQGQTNRIQKRNPN